MADTNVYSAFKGIPIDFLVSTPLLAAARANLALAQNMQEFIFQVAYKNGKSGDLNTLEFDLTRPYTDPNTKQVKTQTIKVIVPLIGIVTIPSLLVDNVTIDFTASVDQASSSSVGVNANVAASYGFGGFSVSGSVTTTVNNTRSTDYSGKYTFHVQADQQPATEGMSQMMGIIASAISPIPTGSSS
jgi:hypothetical protein